MSAPEWHVGQKVVYRSGSKYGEDREVAVTRVGKKYVYVDLHGRDYAFHASDGYEKSDYMRQARIGTPEHFAAWDHREAVMARLHEATRHGWQAALSTEDAERVLAILGGAA